MEITSSLRIHSACGSRLGGVSLEFTGELNDEGFSVTECIGGSMELSEGELGLRYQVCCFLTCLIYANLQPQSFCDPRLNFEQSLDIAFLMSNHFKKERKKGSPDVAQASGDVLYEEFTKALV